MAKDEHIRRYTLETKHDGERWWERIDAVLRAHVERQKKARRRAG